MKEKQLTMYALQESNSGDLKFKSTPVTLDSEPDEDGCCYVLLAKDSDYFGLVNRSYYIDGTTFALDKKPLLQYRRKRLMSQINSYIANIIYVKKELKSLTKMEEHERA